MELHSKENINCPLCNENNYKVEYRIIEWVIAKCNNCGFVYVNPRLQKNEILKLYVNDYFDNTDIGYLHYKENAVFRKKNFEKWVADALPFITQKENYQALDIGCAAGYCLEIFETHSWNTYGLELNQEYASQLTNRNYKIYKYPLLQEAFAEKFDIITLFDVAEHLTDLKENFSKLHSILSDDGTVVIITPNYNSLQRKILGKRWFQFKPAEHINYFTAATFKTLINETGFEIVCTKKAGQYSDAGFLNNRLSKYKLGFTRPLLNLFLKLSGLQKKFFYVDTASLYFILKKRK
jgi:2-polyprenyl-3-methyl-5-hydroxy-6-metoxy-1,4-benzoquinol methylase